MELDRAFRSRSLGLFLGGDLMWKPFGIVKNAAEPPVAYPGAAPDSERAKRPPLPDIPYKPYPEPTQPRAPYEPYKDI
jgi:hypothetical protein